MTSSSFRFVSQAVMTLVALGPMVGCSMQVGGANADESSAAEADGLSGCAPAVPPALAVPAGNKLAFSLDALGVQIYACQGSAWVFQAPEAQLFNRGGHIVGKHYAGPTWESKDGSKVVGAKLASFVSDPSAIPWLLLGAVSHDGKGRMDDVTFIQRLDTAGGLAPTTGCDADHVGAVARVDYAATYFFYEARPVRSPNDE